jgi:Na+-translocating ferredoxin:NAD+ oxidoreductase RnfG subunit
MAKNIVNFNNISCWKFVLKKWYPVLFLTITFIISLILINFTEIVTVAKLRTNLDQQFLDELEEIYSQVDYYTFDEDTQIYTVLNNGQEIGYAFYAKGMGFIGEMEILVGLEDKETIKGIVIISYKDTPWFWNRLVKNDFFSLFIGLKIVDCVLDKDGGQVDGVTGATYSSKGVVDTVREAALGKVQYIE